MKKFRVNDLVITEYGSLAIVEEVCSEGECSVRLLNKKHTRTHPVYGKQWGQLS